MRFRLAGEKARGLGGSELFTALDTLEAERHEMPEPRQALNGGTDE